MMKILECVCTPQLTFISMLHMANLYSIDLKQYCDPDYSGGSFYSEKSTTDFESPKKLTPERILKSLENRCDQNDYTFHPEEICLVYSKDNLESKFIHHHDRKKAHSSNSKNGNGLASRSSDAEFSISDSDSSD